MFEWAKVEKMEWLENKEFVITRKEPLTPSRIKYRGQYFNLHIKIPHCSIRKYSVVTDRMDRALKVYTWGNKEPFHPNAGISYTDLTTGRYAGEIEYIGLAHHLKQEFCLDPRLKNKNVTENSFGNILESCFCVWAMDNPWIEPNDQWYDADEFKEYKRWKQS